jgi:hypothetical protein
VDHITAEKALARNNNRWCSKHSYSNSLDLATARSYGTDGQQQKLARTLAIVSRNTARTIMDAK